jgi:hypothetical protein
VEDRGATMNDLRFPASKRGAQKFFRNSGIIARTQWYR